MRRILTTLLVAGAAAFPAVASGQHIDSVRVEVHAGAAWDAHFGAGVRAEIPIVPDGFITRADDEVAISFGGDVFFWHHKQRELDFLGVVAFQWTFYFARRWSVSGEAGFGLEFDGHDHGWKPHPALAGVGRWHFSERNALVLRVGWPYVAFGITF